MRTRSTLSRLALAIALAATAGLAGLASGCGGGAKAAGATTPGKTDAQTGDSMNDLDPAPGDGSGAPGGDGTPGGGAPGGDDGGMDGPDDAGGVAQPGGGTPPALAVPNQDPDPAEARTAVEAHLRTAREALRGPTLDPDTAIKEAQAALAVDATSVDAQVLIAHAYYAKKVYDNAEVILDMLFKDRPTAKSNPRVYYVYGLIYDHTNRPAMAFVAYKKAVELDGSYQSALINVGVHYLKNKQFDQAVSVYEKLTGSLGVSDASTWNSLGTAYRGKSGDYRPGDGPRDEYLHRSEEAYKRAVSINANYAPAYYNLALVYLDADPFPTSAGPMDTLQRLKRAKSHLDEYRALPGANLELADEQTKKITKAITREEKMRKKAASDTNG